MPEASYSSIEPLITRAEVAGATVSCTFTCPVTGASIETDGPLVKGRVERFELANLNALNFMLYEALDGGGTVSLRTDAQGKVLSTALLRMEIDVPEDVAERFKGRGFVPEDWSPEGA